MEHHFLLQSKKRDSSHIHVSNPQSIIYNVKKSDCGFTKYSMGMGLIDGCYVSNSYM